MGNDALRFPTQSDHWIRTVIVGGVLSLLGVLVVPGILLQGYLLRVVRVATADVEPGGSRELPPFSDWGGLLADGLKLLVVYVVYGLAVLVPVAVTYVVVAVVVGSTGQQGALVAGAVGLVLGSVVLAVGLAVAYVVPAAIANLAIEGTVRAAFDFETIRRGAFTHEYATAWIYAAFALVVLGSLAGALAFLVVGVFVLFYLQVVAAYLFGRGFAAGLAGREAEGS